MAVSLKRTAYNLVSLSIVFVVSFSQLKLIWRATKISGKSGTTDNSLLWNPAGLFASNDQQSPSNTLPNTTQQQQHAIFYNIFIPQIEAKSVEEENMFRVKMMEILAEQINHAAGLLGAAGNRRADLYYNLMDAGTYINHTDIGSICKRQTLNLNECLLLRHYKEGNEYMTHQSLHDYCIKNPSAKVSYIHNKGSYHPNRNNINWRKHMLNAILHPDCLSPPDGIQCDVCALHFYPIWSIFFPGNFWTSDCSYIQRLLPPLDYQIQLEEINNKIVSSGNFSALLYPLNSLFLGNGRYAAEFWVGSHPALRPCDMSQESILRNWFSNEKPPKDFVLASGPRRLLETAKRHLLPHSAMPGLVQNETARKREYFLLAGHLVKWKALYGKFPPDDSWAWEHYFDGDYWKEQVHQEEWKELYKSIIGQSSAQPPSLVAKTRDKTHVTLHNKYWMEIVRDNLTAATLGESAP